MKSLLKALSVFAFVVVAAVAIAACGGGSDSSSSSAETSSGAETSEGSETSEESEEGGGGEISIDVGTGTLEFPAGTTPNIAYFGSSGAAYQETARKTAEEVSKKYGYDLTYFDNKFDPATQLKQMQSALSGGEYNAWISESNAGQIICSTIQQAGEKNIAVVQVTNFTCDQGEKPAGEESWTPGTLSSVGGSTTVTYYEAFAEKMKELLKDPSAAQVGLINGPATISTSTELKNALNGVGLSPVAEVNTNYLTPEGLKETLTMLQAHPEINAIATVYSDLTVGAIRAIESSGKEGEIEVFDLGGNALNKKFIEEGKQTMTAPYFPATVSTQAVEAIHKAFEGEPVEKFYDGFGIGSIEEPFFVTKETAAEYEPEY
jgi:ribose transport system substrate-binding protein